MKNLVIEVENCEGIKGIEIEKEDENLIFSVCNWAAEVSDLFYRLHDSLLFKNIEEIKESQKEYENHIKKVSNFLSLGCKIIK